MKRIAYLITALLFSSVVLFAEETITVSATSSDISESLDLKAVAKIFAQAKDLEQFELMLNNPDSAFTNLDLNGDGDIDYIRVIETSTGSQHLIVLQAVLAKDIYQDVASIFVEKDEANNVKVQIVGDEYIYGANYIIEPVYVYRPVIYDWFWGPTWVCWSSPYYWGYYPPVWYVHPCWDYYWFWNRCYVYHHTFPCCSYRYAKAPCPGYRAICQQQSVSRRDYAVAYPERSFSTRHTSATNARDIRRTSAAEASSRVASGTSSRVASGTVSSRNTSDGRPRSPDSRPTVARHPHDSLKTLVRQSIGVRSRLHALHRQVRARLARRW